MQIRCQSNLLCTEKLASKASLFFGGKITITSSFPFFAVRQNKEPLPIRIDKEPWNLRDLYNYHPYGNDPSFWEGIIKDIENIALKREDVLSEIIPNSFYSEFINREKEVLSKTFNEEEQKAEKMRKKR